MFKIFVFIFLYGAEYLIPNNIVWIICIWTHNQATGLMFQATKPSTAMSVAHSVDYLTVLEVTTLWTSYQMHQTDLFGQQYCTCRPVDTCYQVATILRTWYQMDQTESVWTTTFHLQSRGMHYQAWSSRSDAMWSSQATRWRWRWRFLNCIFTLQITVSCIFVCKVW